jgi:nicotinamide riboside transporter PnuC
MEITSHDILRGLVFAFPMAIVGIWAWSQRRRARRNKELSEVLRRRSE